MTRGEELMIDAKTATAIFLLGMGVLILHGLIAFGLANLPWIALAYSVIVTILAVFSTTLLLRRKKND